MFQVKETRREAPVRAVFYGRPGIGKSTLAAQAPSPIFISLEDGLNQIDAVAIEPTPKTWEDVLAALDYIATLDHQTVVVDSLDHLEPLCWAHVCSKGGKRILGKKGDAEAFGGAKVEHIEAFGYGKGYAAALDEWRVFVHKLDLLRAKGMHAILIAHAIRKPFKNPIGEDYEHWTIKLQEKALGLLIEKCDVVGFCDEDVVTEDTSGRMKAQTTGRRIIRANPHPAYLAKARTRFTLPDKIPLNWSAFTDALRGGDRARIEGLRTELEERIKILADGEVESRVRAFIGESGATVSSLTEAIERLDVTISERKKAS